MTTQLVSTPATEVTYFSFRQDLRLVLKARYPTINPHTGTREGFTKGWFLGFRDHKLTLPTTGPAVLVDTLDGGEAEVEDVAVVHELLAKHRLFGHRTEGFWRHEEPAPPVTESELSALMDAAWDEDRLAEIIRQEEAGWARDALLRPARAALEKQRAALEEFRRREESEAAAKAKGAK